MIRRTALTLAATGLILATALAGCSTAETTGTTDKVATADKPQETTTPTPSPSADTNAKFGETVTYEDLEVSVSAAEPYTPSQYAATGTQPNNVAYTYTVKNTGTKNFDPGLFSVSASSAGSEAEQIFDTEGGLNGTPTTSVTAGQTVTFKLGFNLANPADVTMDVSPGAFNYEAATFTN